MVNRLKHDFNYLIQPMYVEKACPNFGIPKHNSNSSDENNSFDNNVLNSDPSFYDSEDIREEQKEEDPDQPIKRTVTVKYDAKEVIIEENNSFSSSLPKSRQRIIK